MARIRVPPLREHRQDIPLLITAFLAESGTAVEKNVSQVSSEDLQLLMNYDWPGNVRQLKHALEYAVSHSRQTMIQASDLPPEIADTNGTTQSFEENRGESMPLTGEQERENILIALQKVRGNRSKAVKLLGISQATFYRRLQLLNINN